MLFYHCFQLPSAYSVHFSFINVNITKPFYRQANIVVLCHGKHAIGGTILAASLLKNSPFLPGSEARMAACK